MITNTTTTDLKTPTEHIAEHPPGHATPPPGQKKPRMRGLIWLVLMVAVVGVAVFAVWRASQPNLVPPPPQGRGGGRRGGGAGLGPTPVVTAKAKKMPVPVYQTGLGNVSAFYTVTVKTRVDGQLMSVAFNEGDYVKEGQLLAQIDPRPFQVALEQAEGTLARDQATLANDRLDLQRYTTLVAQNAVPQQQLDTQKALVSQFEGTIKTDQANVDNAKLNLVYSKVTAPIGGRVGLRLVDPGNIVHAADAGGLLVITQLQPIAVLFTIPEDTLPAVMSKVSAGVRLPVDAFNRDNSSKLATGYLETVDNQIDATTGTSKLKAVFENKDNSLFPNQFVNMRLLVTTKTDQIVIPSVAIQHGQQGSFVFLTDEESRVKIQPVVPDIVMDGDLTSIASGLKEGDSVVVDGTDRLQDGAQVRLRTAADLAPTAPAGRGRGGRGGRGGKGKKGGGGQPGGGGQ